MKLTKEQKKWKKIAEDSSWVESSDPKFKTKILARNANTRAEKEAKSATINTRIAPSDLEGLKKIASDKAIPYQTLLGSLIHEYVAGKLVDIEEIKKIFPMLKSKAG